MRNIMPKASVILRYCNMSKLRERNLKILVNHILKNDKLEIIIVNMYKKTNQKFTHPNVKQIWIDKPFESSKANNIGANKSSTNIFIFQDADIIFKNNLYNKTIKALMEGYESVRIGEECIQLSELNTKRCVDNKFLQSQINKKFKDSKRDAPGACIALSRKSFIKVGGHCELFKVYGWEDCYFRYKVRKLTNQICFKEQMLHLNHETNYQAGKQAVNSKLYEDLLYTDNGNCVKLSKRDQDDLLKKYPNIKGK